VPEVETVAEQPAAEQTPRKKTRRGSRGGRGRKKPAATNGQGDAAVAAPPKPTIHVPTIEVESGATTNGDEPAPPRKKTRRGSRGGRRRRKSATATTVEAPAESGSDQG
jgi:ribonuclease E